MSSISYANVAAKGTASPEAIKPTSVSPVAVSATVNSESASATPAAETLSATAVSNTSSEDKTTESPSATSTVATSESTESDLASSSSTGSAAISNGSAAPKKEKQSLAPAPVPTKSAWGASASDLSASSSVVDENKWPTPDKVENTNGSKSSQQKFIKPITNKWVPISAKVTLPSARSNGQKQNRARKNKNANGVNPKGNQGSDGQAAPNGSAKKQVSQNTGKKEEGSNGSQYPYNPQYQKFGVNGAPQKNFRRFNNANGSQPFNKRYNNQQQPQHPQQAHPQQPQLGQGIPQNGFYHPQPFVQNPNFQNYNNRQFRPQNGQFRPNRNYRQHNNGYNGAMGMPPMIGPMGQLPPHPQATAQIPPPISPKQDPEQALVQQIDYYFSLENLIRDIYLRKNMDAEGWVSLDLILNFKRVKIIINGIQNSLESDQDASSNSIVLDSIKKCVNLEINYINEKSAETAAIEDVRLRVKDNFEQWLLPAEN
ncbi:uncharacterized protein RJT20DRAFT_100560 [Scheffersomyces xylosifermentans]|uniref:uncharacterized protein n=1 Tax=Scheffersomyces xylosifermentans TaxID=1304137 RepID=UPI00315D6DF9